MVNDDGLLLQFLKKHGITPQRVQNSMLGKIIREWYWLESAAFKIIINYGFYALIIFGLYMSFTYANLQKQTTLGCQFACQQVYNTSAIGLIQNKTGVSCQCGSLQGIKSYVSGWSTLDLQRTSPPINEIIKQLEREK